ncbi:MAG: DNA-binding response regulator [Pseudonocardiaceae bacterium]|nr:DNA-binding response regulator [Pseudonocardiaceae bacterium]
MTAASALERGHQAFERQAWGVAYELLRATDEEAALEPVDLERAGRAAYLTGRDEDCFVLFGRAFHERMQRGDPEGAALDGFWLVFGLMNRGEWARAGGWIGRARSAIDDGQRDCVARGYLLIPDALQALMGGDAEQAYATFIEEHEIGRRFADPDLITLAGLGQGQALIAMGRVADGIAKLDEVMVGITGGEASAIVTGLVYCAVIAACMEIFDPRRAKEWTTALDYWCNSQPELVPFRGQCLVHRAQIMRLHGAWADALDELAHALERLTEAGHPAVGDALYEQAEVHRLRGDVDAAEQCYGRATQFGRDAAPGLALLRLAQGQVDAASAGIRRALDETGEQSRRPRLLSAAVEIALGSGYVEGARTAAVELADLAAARDVALLNAMAAQADAAVLLAEGEPRGALAAARRAWSLWQGLGAPYEAARARLTVGMACRSLGDQDAARMELDAARQVFEDLAAGPDLARVESLTARASSKAGCGLTAREVEVLRMVATGKTNRAIAGELFLSEKTVARHVSNIFSKLGLASRAAATGYAYEHHLV